MRLTVKQSLSFILSLSLAFSSSLTAVHAEVGEEEQDEAELIDEPVSIQVKQLIH